MAKTILIIDDAAASVRQVARIALKGAGYEVIEAVINRLRLCRPKRLTNEGESVRRDC